MRRLYVIAGEKSGDLLGSLLIKSLSERDPSLSIAGWGGDHMMEAGMDLRQHYRETSFMGFMEVVKNLTKIKALFAKAKREISSFSPDAVLLIDYPGFNLRLAKWVKSKGIKTIYYVSPQVWAWKEKRIDLIRKVIDKMIVILPFEKEFYAIRNYDVEYHGHPLPTIIHNYQAITISSRKPIIALLPGSRKQEVDRMLHIMLEAVKELPMYQPVIAGISHLGSEYYRTIIHQTNSTVKLHMGSSYDLLAQAEIAIVTSGTATLEAALFKVPQIVGYKSNWITYHLAKVLINLKFISLVNIILDRNAIPELIQNNFNPKSIIQALKRVRSDNTKILKSYNELESKLAPYEASSKAAESILNFLNNV